MKNALDGMVLPVAVKADAARIDVSTIEVREEKAPFFGGYAEDFLEDVGFVDEGDAFEVSVTEKL